jgi:aminopeptidase N
MKKNKIFSNQKLDFFFVSKLAVMVKDSFKLSHSINVDVTNPNEITSLFDSISYDKVN